jgi:hypothetical protein
VIITKRKEKKASAKLEMCVAGVKNGQKKRAIPLLWK